MNAMPIAAARRLFANRRLAAVVLANGVSSIGDWLYMTVLPLLVFRETGDAATVGLVGAARLLPWLLLSIPAGALVDRMPGPRLLIATDAARAALMFVMAILSLTDAPFPLLLAAAAVAVIAGTVAMPAHGRLLPSLASSDDELGTANVVSATLDNLACVLGPGVAALLVLLGGIEMSFILNGLSFLVVVGVLIRVRPMVGAGAPENADRAEIDLPADGRDGIIGIARGSATRLVVDAAVSFASGALWVLPVLMVGALALGDAAVGLVGIFAGVGGIAGALVAGQFMGGRHLRGMALGLAAMVLGIAAAPVGSSILVLLAGLTIATGALVTVDTLNSTVLQQTTPPHQLGRTLGLLHTSAAASAMAGSALPGIALASLGLEPACYLTASIVGLVGVIALAGPRIGTVALAFWGWLPMFRRSPESIIPA